MASSMAFGGTTQKCRACEKTVYLVDQLTADNRVYHKPCFRCHHCKRTLKLSDYSSFEGVLYCKPHYDQLLKMTGSLDKSFEGASRSAKVERSTNHERHASNKLSSMFVGTQEKCVICKKTVYPIEKVAIDGNSYHRTCFKCSHGGCVISPSNYVAHEGKIYCRHHHAQLFMAKGDFSQLGGDCKHEDIKPPSEKSVTTNGSSASTVTTNVSSASTVTTNVSSVSTVTTNGSSASTVTTNGSSVSTVTADGSSTSTDGISTDANDNEESV